MRHMANPHEGQRGSTTEKNYCQPVPHATNNTPARAIVGPTLALARTHNPDLRCRARRTSSDEDSTMDWHHRRATSAFVIVVVAAVLVDVFVRVVIEERGAGALLLQELFVTKITIVSDKFEL